MMPKLKDAATARARSREHAIAAGEPLFPRPRRWGANNARLLEGAARALTRKRNELRKRLEVAVEARFQPAATAASCVTRCLRQAFDFEGMLRCIQDGAPVEATARNGYSALVAAAERGAYVRLGFIRDLLHNASYRPTSFSITMGGRDTVAPVYARERGGALHARGDAHLSRAGM